MNYFIDFIMHMDQYLNTLVESSGFFVYIILFIVVFCETGLVITPFLPGDSIIFACGALAAAGQMNRMLVLAVFIMAAIFGDTVNYILGKNYGTALVVKIGGRFIKERHFEEACLFYDKYGGTAIFLGRFVPIVRTFVPFVAGISKMKYQKFIYYNILGGITWIGLFLLAGFYFGNIPAVQSHFSIVVLAIILISLLPILKKSLTSKKGHSRNNLNPDDNNIKR